MFEAFLSLLLQPLVRYAEFTGRSTRSEFIVAFVSSLFVTAIAWCLDIFFFAFEMKSGNYFHPMVTLLTFILFVPTYALLVRRMHDIGLSGGVLLFMLVGLAISVVLPILAIGIGLAYFVLILMAFFAPGTTGDNQFGENPRFAARGRR
jgi:uncharacterized membrane protein YhaH (DUF805 family)